MYEVYKSNKEDEALFLLRNKLNRDEAFSVLNELSNMLSNIGMAHCKKN